MSEEGRIEDKKRFAGGIGNTFSSNFVKVEMAKPYYLDKALRIKVLSDLPALSLI